VTAWMTRFTDLPAARGWANQPGAGGAGVAGVSRSDLTGSYRPNSGQVIAAA
jgi:hypothetical protein